MRFTTLGSLCLALTLAGCKHPLEIEGNGDIFSASQGRDCLLEDYLSSQTNCTENSVTGGEYAETYTAVPRPGWRFERWENYCTDTSSDQCSFSMDADTVALFPEGAVAPLRAVFTPEPREIVRLSVLDNFNTPRRPYGVFKDGNYIYVADHSENLLVLEITAKQTLAQVASVELAPQIRAYGLARSGNHLYVAGREGGLAVVDISNPRNPVPGVTIDTPDIAMYVTVDGNQLYLSDKLNLLGFDISVPDQPQLQWSLPTTRQSFLRSTATSGSLAVAGFVDGVELYSFPSGQPALDSSISVGRPAWSISAYQDLLSSTEYFLVGGERAGFNVLEQTTGNRVGASLALTPIPNPTPADETAFGIVNQGHFAYIANGNNGIQAVSLENIDATYIAGNLDLGGNVRDVIVDNDLMVVADADLGVQLLNIAILPDFDGDGVEDSDDDFPSDYLEWRDTDGDGTGNNADPDDDGDGIEDQLDDDIDGDTHLNAQDMFPDDARFWIDSNGDGFGDNEPLLTVDDRSIHAEIQGGWTTNVSTNAFVGLTYLSKTADNSGAFIRWSPIVTRSGYYNAYFAGTNPFSSTIDQMASYEVTTADTITQVDITNESSLRFWNLLGEFYFPTGNSSTITLSDTGDAFSTVYGDAIRLIPSLTVPDTFVSNYQYQFLGNYTNPNLSVWNLKRFLIDPLDPGILYGAFNSTADMCSIDISDSLNPSLLNCYISEDDGAGYEMVRKGQYIILADRYAGIRVFDASTPGTFTLVKTVPTIDKASRVLLDGDVLYVGDTLAGLLTYDVTDPANPIFLGRAEIGAEARDLRIKGDFAFVSNYFKGMAVLNVADPANPSFVTQLKDPWNAFLGGVWDLELAGDYLFMLVQSFGVQIVDVSNPGAPEVISEIRVPNGREFDFAGEIHDDQPPLDLELVNNLLIVSNGAHGVLLFDVADVSNIELVERIDTPSVAGEAELRGSVLYVADGRGSGLQIYDISAYSYLYDPQP